MDEPPAYLQYSRFTLAPDQPPKLALTLAWPLKSYDVLNRWRLVHGAYGYDARTGLLVAFVIDAEGEVWEMRTWRDILPSAVSEHVEKLWESFADIATTAAIEWRLTVSRLGIMTSEEYEGLLS